MITCHCRRRLIAIRASLIVSLLSLLSGGPARAASRVSPRAPAPRAHAAPITAPIIVLRLTAEVVSLLNEDRAKAGVHRLRLDGRLTAIATGHSDDMGARHYFAHGDPFARFRRGGVRYIDAGENIGLASGRPLAEELRLINATMMAEPLRGDTHHAVIVDPGLWRVGIGLCIRPGNTVYVTEDFTN